MSEAVDPLARTRRGWHRVAEHLLAAVQYAETGRIGLRPVPGGFATRQPRRDGLALAVERTDLVVTDASGTRRAPLTTLGRRPSPASRRGSPTPRTQSRRRSTWTRSSTAARTIDAVPSVSAAVAFFEEGRTRAAATR